MKKHLTALIDYALERGMIDKYDVNYAVNKILALIGGDIKGLSIEDKELMRICFLLSGVSRTGLSAALSTAAWQVSKALEITSQPQKEYLARIAASMVPKLNYLTNC